MAGKDQLTAQQFIDAIPKSAGIISTIATRVGCDWHTAKKYIENYPTVKRAYDNEVERMLDLTESELLKKIQEGDFPAIKYYLSTKGKRRGFVESHEITGEDGGAIVIKWDDND